ncbi:hypothetical protein [Methylomonas rosea]|uniref:Uncharacterized protein n=1 Tax=Methylomonas rosea TaxID=2952227 RepID=A0ABT1TYT7_9GAMM|nr:hypothetical protein [Methylomonas sp. WSC-7]MCQ8119935.1 hypothetical protein [Methylomonas sp. WSC-7]
MKILHWQYIAKATLNTAGWCLTGDEHLGSATTPTIGELMLLNYSRHHARQKNQCVIAHHWLGKINMGKVS